MIMKRFLAKFAKLVLFTKKTIQSRNDYKINSEKDIEDTIIRSVDLQKVVMLHRMPGNKIAIFT